MQSIVLEDDEPQDIIAFIYLWENPEVFLPQRRYS